MSKILAMMLLACKPLLALAGEAASSAAAPLFPFVLPWDDASPSVMNLSFWAKSERAGTLNLSLEQTHAPWQNLGLSGQALLTPEWQPFRFTSIALQSDSDARVIIDPPMQTGACWVAGISLRPSAVQGLGSDEQVENATVRLLAHRQVNERTRQVQRDWLRFLWETEDRYWQAMNSYLKGELKVKALIIGTIVGCSTPNLMARLDCVDAHAYWQHPIFPGRPWDPENWVVHNRTMVNEPGGILTDLALRRVWGKPFSVTEMGWKTPQKESVGKDWGQAPTWVEGISARITLLLAAEQVEAWALDERGQRKAQLAVESDARGHAVVAIGPQWRTLWYELLAK